MSTAEAPQVAANPVAATSSSDHVTDFGPRRRTIMRRKTIAPDAAFTTFGNALKAGWQAELQSRKFRQAVMAEFMAMTIFVAMGSAGVVFSSEEAVVNGYFDPNGVSVTAAGTLPPGASALPIDDGLRTIAYTADAAMPIQRIVNISFVFGFMIAILVFATGSISGGNLNPAVTLSLALTGKMSVFRAFCYIIAQCCGATLGSAFIYSLSPSLYVASGGAANVISHSPAVTLWTALGAEFTGTALLLTTISAAADVGREKQNKYQGALTPFIIGLSVLVAHLFLIPIDGCSINPARSFGSAAVHAAVLSFTNDSKFDNPFKDHWVFWIGPLLGGPCAAIVYEIVFKLPPPQTAPNSPGPVMMDAVDDPASLVLTEGGPGNEPMPFKTASIASTIIGSAEVPSPLYANPFDAPQPVAGTNNLNSRMGRVMAMNPTPTPIILAVPSTTGADMADAYNSVSIITGNAGASS